MIYIVKNIQFKEEHDNKNYLMIFILIFFYLIKIFFKKNYCEKNLQM